MKRNQSAARIASIDLVEAAVHLLRTCPAQAWFAYHLGSVPFILGLLFFWTDMSRSADAERHLVGSALGVSLLFTWMKCWHCVFAGILQAKLGGEAPEGLSWRRAARIIVRQLALQPGGLYLLPISLVIFIPFGWLFTFYQNVVAMGTRGDEPLPEFFRQAWQQAKIDAMENHVLMFLLMLLGMFVWLNVAITIVSLPFLLRSLFGIETPFTLSVTTLFNTTFLAVVSGITYLCVDPLVKAAYVLRCFHGQSRQTGRDLRVELRRLKSIAAAVLLIACAAWPSSGRAQAAQPENPAGQAPAPATKAEADSPDAARPKTGKHETPVSVALDRSIDHVLRKPEYTWRAPRPKTAAGETAGSRLWERFANWIKHVTTSFGKWLDRVLGSRSMSAPTGLFSRNGLMYSAILLVAIIIGCVLLALWRIRFSRKAEVMAQSATGVPDLADDALTAEQLPEDGWVRLAAEMMARGDLRLALRAFYLASLAHLATRNLITLARFKSNRDYQHELARRGHAIPEIARLFAENVSTFDRIWYGLHDVSSELVQEFQVKVERIKTC